jgi:hypothetical protein
MKVLPIENKFGLVPYSFEESFRTSAEFSFPSKLVSYVQAGVVPIFIGPKNSSVFQLLNDNNLSDLCITTVNSIEITSQLQSIFFSDLNETNKKLSILSKLFVPSMLQECINDVLNRIL